MSNTPKAWARVALCAAVAITLAGCGLPRSGPSKGEIYNSSVQRQGDAYVIEVDDQVARVTELDPGLAFGQGFANAGVLGSDTIQPGDTLALTIWENVDEGLLVAGGAGAARLEEVQVGGDGFIFVPYAGRLKASGNSPEAIRRIITERLAEQTPDPQVLVQRMAGDGSTVSLIGGVGAQGVYAIERPTRTLTAMLARAGGVTIEPEVAQITVTRGHTQGRVWLSDLYEEPGLDIALRNGDRILVEEDRRYFTALGATGQQAKVPFDTQTISVIEAVAIVGGLNPALADPTGIFVYRDEIPSVASAVLGTETTETKPIIYALDLTKPMGMFVARDFQIRSGDTVYVTQAPFTRVTTVSNSVAAPLATISSAITLENNLNN